jgi:endoribonuclease Dicer
MTFRKTRKDNNPRSTDSISVIVHGVTVSGPINAANMSLAKGLVSERAWAVLSDPNSPYHLPKICNCGKAMEVDEVLPSVSYQTGGDNEEAPLNDETVAGFAALAREARDKLDSPLDMTGPSTNVGDLNDTEDEGEDQPPENLDIG